MRLILRWLCVALALSLSACELIVDPQSSSSSTGTSATTVGSGSTNASTTGTSSGSGSGSGGVASSTGGTGTSSTSSTSGNVSSGSTGVVTTGPATTGSSGGQTCGPFGLTNANQIQSCSTILASPATLGEWPTTREPDSVSPCAGDYCDGGGNDDDYQFAASDLCPDGPELVHSGGGSSLTYQPDRDSITNIAWLPELGDPDTYDNAIKNCTEGWTTRDGGPTQVSVPPAQALFSLITFHISAGGLMDPRLGGLGTFWASDLPVSNHRWVFDFDGGTFSSVSTTISPPAARTVCVTGPAPSGTANVSWKCRDAGFVDDGGTNNMDCGFASSNGAEPFTGLRFRLPPGPVLNHKSATDYCNHLDDTCGVYRLPSYKELGSIVNFTNAITNSSFDDLNDDYWTSTQNPNGNGVYVIHDPADTGTGGNTIFASAYSTIVPNNPTVLQVRPICVTGP